MSAPTLKSKPELLIATDGSCLVNPGGATGWAWAAANGKWASGCQATGTNQVGELWGILSALRDYPTTPLVIQVDSEYAIKATTTWAKNWQKNGWRTRAGKDIANKGLVRMLHSLMSTRPPNAPARLVKVPAHTSRDLYPLNYAADQRAKAAAQYASKHTASKDFTGYDSTLEKVATPRAYQHGAPSPAGPAMCPSCDGPINMMNECRCTQ